MGHLLYANTGITLNTILTTIRRSEKHFTYDNAKIVVGEDRVNIFFTDKDEIVQNDAIQLTFLKKWYRNDQYEWEIYSRSFGKATIDSDKDTEDVERLINFAAIMSWVTFIKEQLAALYEVSKQC